MESEDECEGEEVEDEDEFEAEDEDESVAEEDEDEFEEEDEDDKSLADQPSSATNSPKRKRARRVNSYTLSVEYINLTATTQSLSSCLMSSLSALGLILFGISCYLPIPIFGGSSV